MFYTASLLAYLIDKIFRNPTNSLPGTVQSLVDGEQYAWLAFPRNRGRFAFFQFLFILQQLKSFQTAVNESFGDTGLS